MPPMTVILALVSAPGEPEGDPERRLELGVWLDGRGRLDADAWQRDPDPWPVRAFRAGAAYEGDVQYDPDDGWSLRFFGLPAEGPDAPTCWLEATDLRPGAYVTVTEPGGGRLGYRVVGVG